MKLYIDTSFSSDSSLVQSQETKVPTEFPALFFDDDYELKVLFFHDQENASWVNDQSAIVSFKIGTIGSDISQTFQGTKQGEYFLFNVSFTDATALSFINGKNFAPAIAEFQVEESGRVKTLLQKQFRFKNTFLSEENVVLNQPNNNPTWVDVEKLTAPPPPSQFTALAPPPAPSVPVILTKATAPSLVIASNLSIKPNAPSLFVVREKLDPPLAPSQVNRLLLGTPSLPNWVDVTEQDPRLNIPAPQNIFVKILTRPLNPEWLENFTTRQSGFGEQVPELLSLKISEGTLEPKNGSHPISEEIPFINIGNGETTPSGYTLKEDGQPIYTRDLDDLAFVTNDGEVRTKEIISSKLLHEGQSINGVFPLYETEEIANLANQGSGATEKVIGDVSYWMPNGEDGKNNFDEGYVGETKNADIYETTLVLKYDYSGYYPVNISGTSVELSGTKFKFYNARLFPTQKQVGRLGLRDYGGQQIAFYNEEVQRDLVQARFEIVPTMFAPLGNDVGNGLTPRAPSSLFVATDPPNAPSLIEVSSPDFSVIRYKPSIWLDPSRETSGEPLPYLKNYGWLQTSVKHFNGGEQTRISSTRQNGLRTYDFTNGAKSYIMTNPFEENALPPFAISDPDIPHGGEIEMFFVIKPNLSNNGHLIATIGGNRMIVHAPHNNQDAHFQVETFDQVDNQIESISTASDSIRLNEWAILGCIYSRREGVLKIRINGSATNTRTNVLGLGLFKELRLGGWGNANAGQHCTLGEVLFFKNKIGEIAQEKVEGYLAHKWGLNDRLNNLHPYRHTKPTNFGEDVGFDRFVASPSTLLTLVEPEAPTLIESGILANVPTELEVVAHPANPLNLESEALPPITIKDDGQAFSYLKFTSFEGEEPYNVSLGKTLAEWLESLSAYDELDQIIENVNWGIIPPSTIDYEIEISSSASNAPQVTKNLDILHAPFGVDRLSQYKLSVTDTTDTLNIRFDVLRLNKKTPQVITIDADANSIHKGIITRKEYGKFNSLKRRISDEITSTTKPVEVLQITRQRTHNLKFRVVDTDYRANGEPTYLTPLFEPYDWSGSTGGVGYYPNITRNVWGSFPPNQTERGRYPLVGTKSSRTYAYVYNSANTIVPIFSTTNYQPSIRNPYWIYKITEIGKTQIDSITTEYEIEISFNPDTSWWDEFTRANKFNKLNPFIVVSPQTFGRVGHSGEIDYIDRNVRGYMYNQHLPYTQDTIYDLDISPKQSKDIVKVGQQMRFILKFADKEFFVTFEDIFPPTIKRFSVGSYVHEKPTNITIEIAPPELGHHNDFTIESMQYNVRKHDEAQFFNLNNARLNARCSAHEDALLPNWDSAEKKEWVWAWNIKTQTNTNRMPFFVHVSKLRNLEQLSYSQRETKSIFYNERLGFEYRPQVTNTEYLMKFPNGETQETTSGGYIQTMEMVANFKVYFENWDNLFQEYEIDYEKLMRNQKNPSFQCGIGDKPYLTERWRPTNIVHLVNYASNMAIPKNVCREPNATFAQTLVMNESGVVERLPMIMMPYEGTKVYHAPWNLNQPHTSIKKSETRQVNAYLTPEHARQGSTDKTIFTQDDFRVDDYPIYATRVVRFWDGTRYDQRLETYISNYGFKTAWNTHKWLYKQDMENSYMYNNHAFGFYYPLNSRPSTYEQKRTININGVNIYKIAGIGSNWGVKLEIKPKFTPDNSVAEGFGQPIVKYVQNGAMPPP